MPRSSARKTENQMASKRMRDSLNSIRVSLNGQVTTPPADPTAVNLAPWNNLVVRSTFTVAAAGRFVFQLVNLMTAMIGQLNSCGVESFEVRIVRLSAWETTQKRLDIAPMNLIAVNSTNISNKPLVELHDSPGENHHARTGYLWPKSHSDVVFESTQDTAAVLFEYYLEAGAIPEFHIGILWRIKRPDVTPPLKFSTMV